MEPNEIESWRIRALLFALAMIALQWFLDVEWPRFPEAIAWLAAAVFTVMQARVIKRDTGQTMIRSYLAAGVYVCFAILCIW